MRAALARVARARVVDGRGGASLSRARAPWLEGRVAAPRRGRTARAVDARRGEAIEVFVVANGTLDGRRVVFSDDRRRGHTSWSALRRTRRAWRRVEPRPQHLTTPAPNTSAAVYANAVVLGPDHGKWIGFDRLEYFETPLAGDAHHAASCATRCRRRARRCRRRRRAPSRGPGSASCTSPPRCSSATRRAATPGAEDAPDGTLAARVFRYSFRSGDDFVGWLTSYFNVPYLFGSAGKGQKAQAERYVGADCADVLVAALRRTGLAARVHERRRSRRRAAARERAGARRRPLRARLRRLRGSAALVGPHRRARRGSRPRRQARRQAGTRGSGHGHRQRRRAQGRAARRSGRSPHVPARRRADAFVDGAPEALDDGDGHGARHQRGNEAAVRALLDRGSPHKVVPASSSSDGRRALLGAPRPSARPRASRARRPRRARTRRRTRWCACPRRAPRASRAPNRAAPRSRAPRPATPRTPGRRAPHRPRQERAITCTAAHATSSHDTERRSDRRTN